MKMWTDREIKELGLDPDDGTLCKFKGCDCKNTVADVVREREQQNKDKGAKI